MTDLQSQIAYMLRETNKTITREQILERCAGLGTDERIMKVFYCEILHHYVDHIGPGLWYVNDFTQGIKRDAYAFLNPKVYDPMPDLIAELRKHKKDFVIAAVKLCAEYGVSLQRLNQYLNENRTIVSKVA